MTIARRACLLVFSLAVGCESSAFMGDQALRGTDLSTVAPAIDGGSNATDLAGAPTMDQGVGDLPFVGDLPPADMVATGTAEVTVSLGFLEGFCGPDRPGRVVSSPPGIDCTLSGGTCAAKLPAGSTLRVEVPPGAKFTRWVGGCTGNPCTLRKGIFALRPVLTVESMITVQVANPGGGGFVLFSPSGTRVGGDSLQAGACRGGIATGTCCHLYAPGTTVTLTGSNDPAFVVFERWSGACTGTTPTCTLTVNSPLTVGASLRRVN